MRLGKYLDLAQDFVVKTYEQKFQKEANKNVFELIDELLRSLDPLKQKDRKTAKLLCRVKEAYYKIIRPSDRSNLEAELHSLFLDCGFDVANIESFQKSQHANSSQLNAKEYCTKSQSQGDDSLKADAMINEGKKYLKAKEFKNAILRFEGVLVLPSISTATFMKAVVNNTKALLHWDGTTEERMRAASENIYRAMCLTATKVDGFDWNNNAKLFLLDGKISEWLGELFPAETAYEWAFQLESSNKVIAQHLANVQHKISEKYSIDHLDKRYQPSTSKEAGFDFKFEALFSQLAALDPKLGALMGHIARDCNKDYELAAKSYKWAAAAGSHEAMFNLAHLYAKGMGVERNVLKTIKLLWKAVQGILYEPGVADSYNYLGLLYMNGTGVTQDLTLAKFLLQQSAYQGYPEGLNSLGSLLKTEGRFYEAFDHFQSAALKGCARAYSNLADCYRDGHGIVQNPCIAQMLYEKAIKYGLSLDVNKHLAFVDEIAKCTRIETCDNISLQFTDEALQDLVKCARNSSTAQGIFIAIITYIQAVDVLYNRCCPNDYIVAFFSAAIQLGGHFIQFTDAEKTILLKILQEMIEKRQTVNCTDLAVCLFYLRMKIPESYNNQCSYIAARMAFEGMVSEQEALDIISQAIFVDPGNWNFSFYKARITNTIDGYVTFLKQCPQDHFWYIKALYCIAEIYAQMDQPDDALGMYKFALENEKDQMILFQDAKYEEKRNVALYLFYSKKLNHYPTFLKLNNISRKELMINHNHTIRCNIERTLFLWKHPNSVPMQWTLEDEITQPDPILNTSRELLYEDFDVSKDVEVLTYAF